MEVTVSSNVKDAVAKLAKRASALRDLRPALADAAAEIDRLTAENFEKSKRIDGMPFFDLKESTILGRLRRRKGLFRKATAGTKPRKNATPEERRRLRAQRKAQALDFAKGVKFKPLIDTGRMRNSSRARVVGSNVLKWSIVDYGVPHMTGTPSARPPQRNPAVFRYVYGRWVIEPKVAAFLIERIVSHVAKAGAK